MYIQQSGNNCIVEMYGETRTIPNCNALKLANTLWDKDGNKYTIEEMFDFGFELK